MKYKVVNKDDHYELYSLHYSKETAYEWIEKYGNSGIFVDKSLSKESFIVLPATNNEKPL